jgi:hypothetical protein
MEQGSVERAAVVVVRAWTELGPPRRLKIRIVTAPDVEAPARVIGVTTDIEQACSLVRTWLISMASPGEPLGGCDPLRDEDDVSATEPEADDRGRARKW